MTSYPHRDDGYKLLKGHGLEIGAFHQPAPVPAHCTIEYCDAQRPEEIIKHFPELNLSAEALVKIDYICDLDKQGLSLFSDDQFDFVILNHVIEHVANPIKIVGELFRIIKPGGYVVISAPDKRFTFDHARPLTSFEHLLEEYINNVMEVTEEHYLDFLRGVHPEYFQLSPAEFQGALNDVKQRREHVHVWHSKSFTEFMQKSLEVLNVKADCVFLNRGAKNHFEYFSVWKKREDNPGFIKKWWQQFRVVINRGKLDKKSQDKLIFLHIPKTAGTSLRKIIEMQYPGEECLPLYYPAPYQPAVLETIQVHLPKAKVLYGHVSFGIHQLLGIEGKYIVFLRNPIDRIVSFYNHHARDPNMFYYSTIQEGMTLLDMVESEITLETNNHIVRILTGNGQLEMLDDTSVLQLAIKNINLYFSFVGLMEQFHESVLRLGQQLGWQTPMEVPYLNDNPIKLSNPLDVKTQAVLEKYNRLDLLLYRYVSRAFATRKQSLWKGVGCGSIIIISLPDFMEHLSRWEAVSLWC